MFEILKRITALILAVILCISFASVASAVSDVSAQKSDVLFYDNFETYNNDTALRNIWVSNRSNNTVVDTGYYEKSMSIPQNSSGSTVKVSFLSPISESVYEAELIVKPKVNFSVGIVQADDTIRNLIGTSSAASGDELYVGYYPASKLTAPINSDCKITFSDIYWSKIKFRINRIQKTITVIAGTGTYTAEITDEVDDAYGLAITTSKSWNYGIVADEIKIMKDTSEGSPLFDINLQQNSDVPQNVVLSSAAEKTDAGLNLIGVKKISNGVYQFETDPSIGNIGFRLDYDKRVDVNNRKNIYLEVTYSDVGFGRFFVRYPGADDSAISYISLGNTGEEKTATVLCDGFEYNSDLTGYDFEVCTTEHTKKTQLETSSRKYSESNVLVSRVRCYTDNTYSPFEISVESDNPGNIFYGSQLPNFRLCLINCTDIAADVNIKYEIRGLNRKNEKESKICEKSNNRFIDGYGTFETEFAADICDYGLYTAEISVSTSSEPLINQTKSIPFSKCIKNDSLNYDMGASVHFTRKSDTNTGLKLMGNAGLGILRDDFEWDVYEKTKGRYALTERQEALLDAAAENKMQVLPILGGNNQNYEETTPKTSTFPSTDASLQGFADYAVHLLNEPKIMAVSNMAEIINEPELIRYSGNTNISENYQAKGEAYAKILEATYDAIKSSRPECEVTAFSAMTSAVDYIGRTNQNTDIAQGADFYDYALGAIGNKPCFDIIGMHMYPNNADPEIGFYGWNIRYGGPAYSSVFMINWLRGLFNGGKVYDYTSCTGAPCWVYPKGRQTKNTYNFNNTNPMWHTEAGYNSYNKISVRHTDSSNEWQQGLKNVRLYTVIKANSHDDKVWFYDFINDGIAESEKEYNFGMVKSDMDEVPYAAKYSYLMISALNALTGADATVTDYKEDTDNFTHIAKYESAEKNRDTYMLWTTNHGGPKDDTVVKYYIDPAKAEITKEAAGIPENSELKYFDIMGNPLSESEVMVNGKYQLTDVPFYAIVGNTAEIENKSEDNGKTSIWLMDGKFGSKGDFEITSSNRGAYRLSFSTDRIGTHYILYGALYKGEKMIEVKTTKGVVSDTATVTGKFNYSASLSEFDKIKYILFDGKGNLMPLCEFVEVKP